MSDADPPLIANDWLEMALKEIQAARVLARFALWQQCYHHAGFAVECALKFRIMGRYGLNRWPDRQGNRRLFSHNLVELASEAGLATELGATANAASDQRIAFLIVKDWSNEARYDPREFPEIRAQDMLSAVDGGLLSWLLRH